MGKNRKIQREANAQRALRERLEAVAARHPGTKVIIDGLYEGADIDGLDRVDSLLTERKILRVLNRNGYFVVPIDDGRWIVTVGPQVVLEVRHVRLSLLLRTGVQVEAPKLIKVLAWLVDTNAAGGPKVAYLTKSGELHLCLDLPESGLTAGTLMGGVTVMGRLAAVLHEEIESIGVGKAPLPFWEQCNWPRMPGVFRTSPRKD